MLAQHRPALPPPTYKHAADPPSPYKTLIATPPDDPTPSIQVRQGDSPLPAKPPLPSLRTLRYTWIRRSAGSPKQISAASDAVRRSARGVTGSVLALLAGGAIAAVGWSGGSARVAVG